MPSCGAGPDTNKHTVLTLSTRDLIFLGSCMHQRGLTLIPDYHFLVFYTTPSGGAMFLNYFKIIAIGPAISELFTKSFVNSLIKVNPN